MDTDDPFCANEMYMVCLTIVDNGKAQIEWPETVAFESGTEPNV